MFTNYNVILKKITENLFDRYEMTNWLQHG